MSFVQEHTNDDGQENQYAAAAWMQKSGDALTPSLAVVYCGCMDDILEVLVSRDMYRDVQ